MKRIMDWFNPPVFPGNEEKTLQAQLFNMVGRLFAVMLILAGGLYVPLLVSQKLYSWLIILALFATWLLSRHWAARGHVRLAGLSVILVAWVLFFGMAWTSGNATGTAMIYVAATIVVAALLLGAKIGNLLAAASALLGLSIAISHGCGYAPPVLFTFSPLRQWAVFAFGIGFIIAAMNLVTRNLRETLAFARQENAARRQAEAALRVSADRYRTLTEKMGDVVFTTDATGVITYLSAAAHTLFGQPPQAMVGQRFTEFLAPASIEKALTVFRATIAQSGEVTLELIMKRANGTTFLGELKSVRFEDHGEIGTLGVIRDITARQQTEAALRESEERYRRLAEDMPLYISTFLPDSSLTYVNEGLAAVSGQPPAALLGQRFVEMLPPSEQSALEAYLKSLSPEHPIESHEQSYVGIDGREYHQLWINRAFFDAMGRVTHFQAIGQDITARKRAEVETRRRTEKLSALYAMARRVNASLSLEHLVEAALEEIMTAVRPDVAYFFLRAGERLLLQQIAPEDLRAKLEIPEHRVGECMCGLAVTQGKALYSRDIFADLRCTWMECKEAGFRSFAALPLSNGAAILGVIGVATTSERDFESEAEFLETLVSEISISLQNVRLYEQLKDHTVALENEVAERRRIEAVLRESEERTRLVTEMTTDYIFIVDVTPEGLKLRWASDSMARMTGRTVADATTSDMWASIIYPDDAQTFFAFAQRTIGSAQPGVLECRSLTASGAVRWIQINAYPRVDAQGVTVSIVGAIKDVTDRKQAEESLRISLEKYRVLFETLPLGITVSDARGQIIEVNPASERLLGLSSQAHEQRQIADPVWRIIRPNGTPMPPADYASVRALHENRLIENVEMGVYRPDGSIIWLNVTAAPIPLEGYGVIIVYNDISARKEMEEHLRRQERLAAVGQLSAGIAHDFRNLLTTIILYAQLGLHKPGLPDGVARGLETIVGESRKATELIQQILDFSSRGLIERRPIELGDYTRKVLTVLQRTIPETIRITMNVQTGEFVVAADAGRLQQVLTNLVLNARDAMPSGGQLHIGLERFVLKPNSAPPTPEMTIDPQNPQALRPHSVWVCLSVADTGTGMTEEGGVGGFQPFFTTKEAGKGAGLGLAQVYGIIRQHDGYIGVETAVGQGTTFRLYLPASATTTAPVASGERLPTLPGQGETLLLVEDNLTLRDAGQNMLAALGYHVLSATNGREALQIYQATPEIALIITDLVMPEMGGKALMETLRQRTPDVKVLAVTGYAPEEDVAELRAAGFRDILHKPFDIETLAQEIRRVLDEPT